MVDTETTPNRSWSGAGGRRRIEDVKQHPSPGSSPKQPSPTCTSSPASKETASATTKLGATRRTPKRQSSDVSLSSSTSSSTSALSTMLKEGITPTQRISRAKKGKRVHACHHPGCEKIFTRAEHLRRHQLNHSPEVYYKCELCERTFVRQDLLTRHTERHATQARKAVQTLAMTQRHRQFATHFGIDSIAVLAAPPPPEYGGNAHLFDILNVHSSHQSSPAASIVSSHSATSMAGYAPEYPGPISIPISQSPEAPPDFTPAETTVPSKDGLRGVHLPFHLQHNEPQRQQEQFMIPATSNPDVLRRSLTAATDPLQQQSPPHQQQHIW
ncbi:hypothetical protein FN846DRAFT_10554 [Sphaerosporella brunnea]|uniref:C2H2-type domain-containing protein n=1 Tax=Sphaerosporella brunnea TaxID=1250544 RepID=A0A5J5EWC6_9PEZI|nr:hypothetical protein FN846DRAFT_10554 [Sphaerosporella brunnea]